MSENAPITQEVVDRAVEAALEAISEASSTSELLAARAAHLGENSPLAKLNSTLKDVPPADRAALGKLVGQARGRVTQSHAARQAEVAAAEEAAQIESERIDVTALPLVGDAGSRHPLTLLQDRVTDIFVGMGWEIVDGPELESSWYNFDALNFPPDHPARAMQDTFFVEPVEQNLVMRTHTSPVQIRAMLERDAPLYVLAPGKVYRTDEWDATHAPVFHQFEGLAIDEGLTMADLRGTLEHFARTMFGPDAKIRLRPNYFPFTEPSAELDLWHPTFVDGPRWIEWGGCGMVHPNVLRSVGLDPERFGGFAFGMGIERALMFRNGVDDMREMGEGDVRFSQQFGMVV